MKTEIRGIGRRLFFSIAAAAAVLVAPSLAIAGHGQGHTVGHTMTLSIENAVFTFTSNGEDFPNPPRTFVVVGDVDTVDGEDATGFFYCTGVLLEAGDGAATFVSQRFSIDGEGTILGGGAEGDDEEHALGIVGGTGNFVGAVGSYEQTGGTGPFGNGIIEYTFKIQ